MSQGGPSSLKKLFSKKNAEEKVEEEILSMVEEGHEQGIIEETEAEMISNIFEFSDKEAKDIMTSRQKIIAVESTITVDEALKYALENSFSRYPVYEEDIDNVIGVIHLKDLIAAYLKDPEAKITEVMDEPIFIHPTFNISKLLQKMQNEKIHMAIIVDEYGQTEGLVAMEDIIEEIVGNIFDEHDDEELQIRRLADGGLIVKGSAPLNELADEMEIEFPDEDIETINGFLLYKLGRLPVEHEKTEIVYEGYKFIPLRICDKMITLVKIEKSAEEDKDKE
ncbi:MAG: hemolysin family protein [Clostridium sp.]|nr:hemolysin family protein [Clostridium sp.]MCM1171030.1 hemolysin family protein [Clostridium sp.]MCM1209805.1 hemolysin family protein [Ruminococcus sp.]